MTNKYFESKIIDSKKWSNNIRISRLTFISGLSIVILNYRGKGGGLTPIIEDLGIPDGIRHWLFLLGFVLLGISAFHYFLPKSQGSLVIEKGSISIGKSTYISQELDQVKFVLNNNASRKKPVYGERNHKTGGRNFVSFIKDKEEFHIEFYVKSMVEEQKLREIIDSWGINPSQPPS